MSKWILRMSLAGGGGACLAIFLNFVIVGGGRVDPGPFALPVAAAQSGLRPEEEHLVKLFEKASRSVVFITNAAIKRSFFFDTSREVTQGSGSGFVWDKQGHIVTNYHVIAGADSIFLGDQLLTTPNPEVDADHALLQRLGLHGIRKPTASLP